MYPTYREFFDSPRHYASKYNNQEMTNAEFFRENAPKASVARLTKPPKRFMRTQNSLSPSDFSHKKDPKYKSFFS